MKKKKINDNCSKPLKGLGRFCLIIWTMIAVVLSFGLLAPHLASAATIYVNTIDDEDNEDNNDEDCSLREAIRAANENNPIDACAAGNGHDEIRFLINGKFLLSKRKGDLDIKEDLDIIGDGRDLTIIDGHYDDRVLDVMDGSTLYLESLTIQHGFAEDGGGIRNEKGCTLTISDCVIQINDAGDDGGAIYNDGHAIITGSKIRYNFATKSGGGIVNHGELKLNNSIVNENWACEDGGGIQNNSATTNPPAELLIIESSIYDNFCHEVGGGIDDDGGRVTLIRSSVHNNQAPMGGGGIDNDGQMKLFNTTIANNRGGGYYSDYYVGSGGILTNQADGEDRRSRQAN